MSIRPDIEEDLMRERLKEGYRKQSSGITTDCYIGGRTKSKKEAKEHLKNLRRLGLKTWKDHSRYEQPEYH